MHVVLHVVIGAFLIVQSALGLDLPKMGLERTNLLEELFRSYYNPPSLPPGLNFDWGPYGSSPSVILSDGARALKIRREVWQNIVDKVQAGNDMTILFTLKQEPGTTGTILSFSDEFERFLEVTSSGRRNRIGVHYTHAGRVLIEEFDLTVADGQWHRLAVTLSGEELVVALDCRDIARRRVLRMDAGFRINDRDVTLWVGQRSENRHLYQGAFRDLMLVTGPNGISSQCQEVQGDCPTCGQFYSLSDTVRDLQQYVLELANRLSETELKLKELEKCDCQISCKVNGTVRADGATWQDGCRKCSCVRGDVQCRRLECEPPRCKNPIVAPGDCCPVCLKQCLMKGETYDHGDVISPRPCLECRCDDGKMTCKRIDPRTCPRLECPPSQQFLVDGECCMRCPGEDFCAMTKNPCPEHATCFNLNTTYACQCNPGYWRNSSLCSDIDECAGDGGHPTHHCHLGTTKCVNIPGSYECQCLPGLERADAYSCRSRNECAAGDHDCHPNAVCKDLADGFKCTCLPGFVGDGRRCRPVCSEPCLNGGVCTSPDTCRCLPGFKGARCELDVDECTSGIHDCPSAARCVNRIGSFSCECPSGFELVPTIPKLLGSTAPTTLPATTGGVIDVNNNDKGSQQANLVQIDVQYSCVDIDECVSGQHTCDLNVTTCVNVDGSYECVCREKHCTNGCVKGDKSWKDGESWLEGCSECTCNDGKVTCGPVNCSSPTAEAFWSSSANCSRHPDCCPQNCDRFAVGGASKGTVAASMAFCSHPALPSLRFRSGERFPFQCQICECWRGQVDCVKAECPRLNCDNPVFTPEDPCCPKCPTNRCSSSSTMAASTSSSPKIVSSTNDSGSQQSQPCEYLGEVIPDGASLSLPPSHCSSCQCRAGRLCCSFASGDASCAALAPAGVRDHDIMSKISWHGPTPMSAAEFRVLTRHPPAPMRLNTAVGDYYPAGCDMPAGHIEDNTILTSPSAINRWKKRLRNKNRWRDDDERRNERRRRRKKRKRRRKRRHERGLADINFNDDDEDTLV